MKKVKVNYPKKKARIRLQDLGDVSEPERCSMYQVLQDNLKLANRTTFLHRIIYVAAHTFPCADDSKMVMKAIIVKCNESYCLEKLSGFLLYYPQYFVHMVEGDEDNLNKHLGYLLDENAYFHKYLGTMKLIVHVSNINQRFSDDWMSTTGTPSKFLEKLDINADLQQSGRNVFNCIKKMYTLISSYTEALNLLAPMSFDKPKHEFKLSATPTLESLSRSAQMISSQTLIGSISDSQDRSGDMSIQKEFKFYLPEYELLDFVLYCSFTMKLEDYYGLYGFIAMRGIYKDSVWPTPHDFIPYDVFEKPYTCVTELVKDHKRRLTVADRTADHRLQSTTGSLSSFSFSEIPKNNSVAHPEDYSSLESG